MKSTIETFNYQEPWLRSAFHNGKSAIDSLFIADILGTGWSSPWDIWTSLKTFVPAPMLREQLNSRLQWTPMLRKQYEQRSNRSVDLEWRRIHHPKHDWCTASILGLTEDPLTNTTGGLLFTMSTDPEAWLEDGSIIEKWTLVLPPNIAMEAYWMMFCSQLPWIDITVGFPSNTSYLEIRIIRIFADERLQQNLWTSAKAWRENHLLNNVIPSIDASRSCTSYLMERFAHGTDALREATDKEEAVLTQYEEVSEQLRELQARQQLLRNELFRQIGHFAGLKRKDGNTAVLQRNRNGLQLRVKRAS